MPAASKKPLSPAASDTTSPEAVEIEPVLAELLPQLRTKTYNTKLSELPAYQAIRAQDAAYQGRVALALAVAINLEEAPYSNPFRWEMGEVLAALLRTSLALTEADYLRLFASYGFDFTNPAKGRPGLFAFPITLVLSQLAKLAKRAPLGEPMLALLRQLRDHSTGQTGDWLKIHLRAREILNHAAGTDDLPVVVFADGDPLGQALGQFVASLDRADPRSAAWLGLLQQWQKATAGQPTLTPPPL